MALTIKPEYFEKWIAGGWQFEQILPGNLGVWHAPHPLINSFRKQVGNIISWRKANPVIATKLKLSTDWDVVAKELIDQNMARLLRLPRGDYYLHDDAQAMATVPAGAQKKSLWAYVKEGAVAMADMVASAANGETTLQEWLGDGGMPVAPELSEKRAEVCVACPQNTRQHWSLFFTRPVAALFAKTVEERNRLKLSTSHDHALGACKACGCVLELKVHVPLKHIVAHTKPETWTKLDERCWMRKENLPL